MKERIYRIKKVHMPNLSDDEEKTIYYPQYKGWFWWKPMRKPSCTSIKGDEVSFTDEADATRFILNDHTNRKKKIAQKIKLKEWEKQQSLAWKKYVKDSKKKIVTFHAHKPE